MNVRNMQRMNEGAYLKFTSVKVESDNVQRIEFDAESKAVLDAFPESIVSDKNNVTTNVTLPYPVESLKWSTSDQNVMTKTGRISRTSPSDPTSVVLSTTYNATTVTGETVPVKIEYSLNVTGCTTRSENTKIINPVEGATDTTEKYYTMPVRGNEQDGYPMFDDPDYISDEVFFGIWDSGNSKWTSTPYFRYEEFPEMSKIEATAKAGDYEKAKDELVAYYRLKAPDRISAVTSISNANKEYYNELYQLLSRNAYVTNFISNYVIRMFSIPKNWSDVTI